MPNVHNLRIQTSHFQDTRSGLNQFEVIENNKKYEVGDTLILEEVNEETQKPTGAWIPKLIIYKMDNPCFVILGTKDIKF